MTCHFYCPSPEATAALAARIAAHLGPRDALLLHGDVGAGKSHFARSLIRALLPPETKGEDIPSPTFTLVQTYQAANGTAIWHADLYRLSTEEEAEELGFVQAFDEAITLVEWPEKLGDLTPERRLDVSLAQSRIDEDARTIAITPQGPGWEWLGDLVEDRVALRAEFLSKAGWGDAAQKPITGDASNRSYTRLQQADTARAILMDAPPARGEDTRPFLAIGRALSAMGYSAPEVYAADEEHGLLLLEDLGDGLYARLLETAPQMEAEIYAAAVDLLVDLQTKPMPDNLPEYSQGIYQRESRLLLEWYAGRIDLSDAFRAALSAILARLSDGPRVTILRDYHAENLLWLPERGDGLKRVGLLDFQDALAGHPAYDLVSLLEDARRDVTPSLAADMRARFAAGKGLALSVVEADCAILGAQRNAKILGLFTRLAKQSGKAQYLALIPRVRAHLQSDLSHPACADLRAVVAQALPKEFGV